MIDMEKIEKIDKSLEEAATTYAWEHQEAHTNEVGEIEFDYGPRYSAFIAGAEWQASQMPMPEDTVLFQKGVAEGRRLEREDMRKDAVEGEAEELYNDGESQGTVGVGTYFKPGEKVYVLKAEKE